MTSSADLFDAAQAAITALRRAWSAAQHAEGTQEVCRRLDEQNLTREAFRRCTPAAKPVTRHLPASLAEAAHISPDVAEALAILAPSLNWLQSQSYTDEVLGPGFSENYAWCELVGAEGFFRGEDFNLGFLLLGPQRHYIDHYHPAPELYWPLTAGSLWKKGDGAFLERQQGEVIWHPSMVVHATKTGNRPLLAAFAWTHHADIGARLCALDPQP